MICRNHALWACALLVEKRHGQQAGNYIANHVERLAFSGDTAAAEFWEAIGHRYDALQGPLGRIS
jgi:hypothetical protein